MKAKFLWLDVLYSMFIFMVKWVKVRLDGGINLICGIYIVSVHMQMFLRFRNDQFCAASAANVRNLSNEMFDFFKMSLLRIH